MIEQVRLVEVYSVDGARDLTRTVFAFGSHPMATPDDEHPVTTAKASGNKLRIIMDELLRGNHLEEIACRAIVDDDVFARVPVGATPDDIARCSVAVDLLPARCPGSDRLSVCLCQNDGGCVNGTKIDGTPNLTPRGESVGVLDLNQDGAADNTRFIQGAVSLGCSGIDVPIDLDQSYWTPSGNQQKPAQGGFDVLGPAVVLIPQGALPSNATCGVTFAPEVVDKDGNQVCAPPEGDIAAGCTPGDTSAFSFATEPLSFVGVGFDRAVPRTASATIVANVPLDPATLANITVTEAPGTDYTQFTAALVTMPPTPNQIAIAWTAVGGLAPLTQYTINLPTTVTDTFHRGPPQPVSVVFTTAAN